MISFEESMRRLNSVEITPSGAIELPLMEALGYHLAEDIVATYNSPEYPTSAMDGYAIRFEDQVLKELQVEAINPAGAKEVPELTPGRAVKTYTGSLMPNGSNTLIPIENVKSDGNKIIIEEEVSFGFSVREVGESFQKGEVLIKSGTKIDFEEISVLASLNFVKVKVYTKPKVAIIATGSELLELGEEQTRPSQIRSSNNYTIEAIVKKYGGEPLQFGCIGDDIEALKVRFKEALQKSDIVVSTGGVSVGDFDFVKDIVRDELGAEVLFKGVVIKPGQHIMVAKSGSKMVVALPGFAYSSTVTALLYLVPLLYRYNGTDYQMPLVEATLRSKYKKRSKKTEFTAANLSLQNGKICIDFIGKKSGTSAIMTNMLGSVALAMGNPEDGDKESGETIQTLIYNLNLN